MTVRSFTSFIVTLFVSAGITISCQSQTYKSVHADFDVETIAGDLENAWALAFLPGGDMLVTERAGRLRIIRDGVLLDDAVPGLPEIYVRGQGGLLDVILHPDFSSNRLVYISYSKPVGDGSTTAVIRGRFENDQLLDVEEIFEANSQGRGHYGCRLAFDADGYLYVTIGDRQAAPRGDLESHPAQDLSNHHGTTNRIYDDGRIPSDNPFVGQAGVEPSIWSYGHRNQQGLAIHPETGDIWATEHGPQGGDELNLVRPGLNFGWPVIGYGVNYRSGTAIHESTHREGMEQPAHFWVPSIATSGLMIYSGDVFPDWKGDIFVGGMAGTQLARLTLDGQNVTGEETLAKGLGRIRDVRQGPEGFIYLVIDNDKGPQGVVKMVPKKEQS